MPSRQAYDGGHTAFTDHQILAKPRRVPATPAPARKLTPWRAPAPSLARRNLGLAYISVGERDQSAELLNEGFRHLSAVERDFASDAVVLTSLGAVLQRKGVPRAAARYFQRAAELEPRDTRHRLNLAVAFSSAGETGDAVRALEGVISEDPSLVDAYLLLAEIYRDTGNEERRLATLRRYLRFAPQSINVRKLLRPSR
jgi:tetratricopeptide (TPR) repeat protein